MKLVTGAAGYIGSHFVKAYLTQFPSEAIVAVDNLSEGHREALQFSSKIHFEQTDVGDVERMRAILKQYDVDTVIHFAASCYVGESQYEPVKYFRNNVVQSLQLFQAMQECGVRQLVFSSTCAVYGNPETLPIDEQHVRRPINVYGSSKLMVEEALRAYALSQNWSYVALRYFNASGADESGVLGEHHEPETHLIPLALQAAQGRRPALQIYGNDYDTPDGTCIRDYIHVNDLAQAHIQAIDYLKKHPGASVFNLGTTVGSSVLDVLNACQAVTGRPIPVDYVPRRPGDPPVLVANAEKAHRELGWQPRYDLRRIVETAWAWEQSARFQRVAL